MRYLYKTQNTCSTEISFDISGDIVSNIQFNGGCMGNLSAISRLVDGLTVDEIEKKCKNIICGRRGTSCADQLASAVREAYEKQ